MMTTSSSPSSPSSMRAAPAGYQHSSATWPEPVEVLGVEVAKERDTTQRDHRLEVGKARGRHRVRLPIRADPAASRTAGHGQPSGSTHHYPAPGGPASRQPTRPDRSRRAPAGPPAPVRGADRPGSRGPRPPVHARPDRAHATTCAAPAHGAGRAEGRGSQHRAVLEGACTPFQGVREQATHFVGGSEAGPRRAQRQRAVDLLPRPRRDLVGRR